MSTKSNEDAVLSGVFVFLGMLWGIKVFLKVAQSNQVNVVVVISMPAVACLDANP